MSHFVAKDEECTQAPEPEQCTLGSQAPQWTQPPQTMMTPPPAASTLHKDVIDCTQLMPDRSSMHNFDWAAAMQAASFIELLSKQYT